MEDLYCIRRVRVPRPRDDDAYSMRFWQDRRKSYLDPLDATQEPRHMNYVRSCSTLSHV